MKALAAIQRPSRTLLFRLIRNPDTPSNLVTLAAKRYSAEILKWELKNARRPEDTPNNNQ